MITYCWDINVYFSGCFKDGFVFFNLNLDVVYEEFHSFRDCFSLPRMGYCLRLTCQDAWKLSFTTHRLARSTTILDFFAMFFSDRSHQSPFNVEFVLNKLKNAIRTCFDTFPATITFVSVNDDEVVSGPIFIAIMSLHLTSFFNATLTASLEVPSRTMQHLWLPLELGPA